MSSGNSRRKLSQLIGIPELMVAMYPILIAYPNYIGLIAMVLVALFFIVQRKSVYWYRPLLLYLIFFAVHELLLLFVLPSVPSYFVNRTLTSALLLFLVFIIAPNLRYEKMYNAIMLVAIICILGLLYHLYIVIRGGVVSTIQIPLLPRVTPLYVSEGDGLNRPCSFFIEPAAFASFMMVPLAWSLIKNKMLPAVLISFAVFLSTSTNGFAFTIIMWLVFLVSNKRLSYSKKVVFTFLLVILFYFGINIGLFEIGITKIEDTNFSDDVRLTSGINLYKNIPFLYKLFGVDAANIYDFIKLNPDIITGGYVISISENGVYLPQFWEQAIKFGFIGVILYVYCYLGFWKDTKLRPYIVVCIVSLFSQSGYLFYPIVIMIMLTRYKYRDIDELVRTK